MDKNTLIGSLLIGLILLVWLMNTSPAPPPPNQPTQEARTDQPSSPSVHRWTPLSIPAREQVTINNRFFKAEFSLTGAQLKSLQLPQHTNGDQLVDMVRLQGEEPAFFTLQFDGIERPDLIPFTYQQDDDAHVFRARIQLDDGSVYQLAKKFLFSERGYMIALTVSVKGEDGAPVRTLTGASPYLYQLSVGPQIGPDLGKIGTNRNAPDTRSYQYYNNQKILRAKLSGKRASSQKLEESLLWAAISGKYYTVVGLPRRSGIDTLFEQGNPKDEQLSSRMVFARRFDGNYGVNDDYYYYLGPKRTEELSIYDKVGENDFRLSNLRLSALSNANSLLGWLEVPIKWTLQAIYRYLVPNYGVAIILLAILIRVLLAPLTIKSYRSTSRMQALQPKMKALQEKYKEDKLQLQKELSALYKREGVSPMGGCLPILLQMPVIIALANLFSRYFEFRGAVFIPGWIKDLSSPESVYTLNFPAALPLIGDATLDIRLLPVIYLGSQLLLTRVMQRGNPSQSMGQMKLVMTLMPFIFFFILYSLPSGLIMYWTISNFLIMVQQVLMAKYAPKQPAPVPALKKGRRR